jgi:hypothetical protein
MGHLVGDDVVFDGTVTAGVGNCPKIHAHAAGRAVSRRGEVGVVGAGAILDGDEDTVVADSALTDLGLLEVEGRLGEAVLVCDVVNGVHDVEGVDDRGILLVGGARIGTVGVIIDELARSRQGRRGANNVSEGVVTRGVSGLVNTVGGEPAVRGGSGVLWVNECLKAFGRILFVNWEHTKLWREFGSKTASRANVAYSGLSDEVGDTNELAGLRINESFEPCIGLVILDLNDMSEHGGLVSFDDLNIIYVSFQLNDQVPAQLTYSRPTGFLLYLPPRALSATEIACS